MEQVIQIDLANNKHTAYENYADIKKAVENAQLGLLSKYNVKIRDIQTLNEKVIMHIIIPDDIADNFSIGNHLRGVSTYLMKNYYEKYSALLVGKRLLTYTTIPKPTDKDDSNISFNDKLSAINKFVELLKHDDEDSQNKISKIINILYKED